MRFLLICSQTFLLIFAHNPSRFRRDDAATIVPDYTSTDTSGTPQITSEAPPQIESDNFEALTFDELESNVKEEETKLTNLKEEADKSKTDYDTKNEELTVKTTECEKLEADLKTAEDNLTKKSAPLVDPTKRKNDAIAAIDKITPDINLQLISAPELENKKISDLESEFNKFGADFETTLDTKITTLTTKDYKNATDKRLEMKTPLDQAVLNLNTANDALTRNNCKRPQNSTRKRRDTCEDVNKNIDKCQKEHDDAKDKYDKANDEVQRISDEIKTTKAQLKRGQLLTIFVPLLREKETQEAIVKVADAEISSIDIVDVRNVAVDTKIKKDGCVDKKTLLAAEVDALKKTSEEKSSAYQKRESRVAAMKGEMEKKAPSAASSSGMMIGIIAGILFVSVVGGLVAFFLIKKKNGGGGNGGGKGKKKPTMPTTTESKAETPAEDKPKDEKVKSDGDKSNSANPPKSSEKKTSENPKASEAVENNAVQHPGAPAEDKPKEKKITEAVDLKFNKEKKSLRSKSINSGCLSENCSTIDWIVHGHQCVVNGFDIIGRVISTTNTYECNRAKTTDGGTMTVTLSHNARGIYKFREDRDNFQPIRNFKTEVRAH